jgi:hypothetical protein
MPTKVDRSDHPRSRMQADLDQYPCLIELIWSAVRTQHKNPTSDIAISTVRKQSSYRIVAEIEIGVSRSSF